MYVQHVIRAIRGSRPLASPKDAERLWRSLRRAFPDALAACLIPNHAHLLNDTDDPARDHDQLVHVAGAFTRRTGATRVWEPSPPPERVAPDKLATVIRYIHLNGPRARIADGPAAHRWSTHRGAIGLEHDPWVPGERIAHAIESRTSDFAEWFHAYVASDASVSPNGARFPARAPTRVVSTVPLEAICAAARAATFWCSRAVERHASVLLAIDQGWPIAPIARAIGIAPDSVRRLARRPEPALLDAAKLCLGDPYRRG